VGHPLLGDDLYGSGFKTKANRLSESQRAALKELGRQALHAAVLGFEHPRSGEALRFQSPLPAEMGALLNALGTPAPPA
jgi:23S rRNA pseudouridine1911/1915/1917 synthase